MGDCTKGGMIVPQDLGLRNLKTNSNYNCPNVFITVLFRKKNNEKSR